MSDGLEITSTSTVTGAPYFLRMARLVKVVALVVVALAHVGRQAVCASCVYSATNMNEHSSRSHAILIVTVECSSAALADDGKEHIRVGKLNLVDLAGSERQSKTGSEGERFKEATKMCAPSTLTSFLPAPLVAKALTGEEFRCSDVHVFACE